MSETQGTLLSDMPQTICAKAPTSNLPECRNPTPRLTSGSRTIRRSEPMRFQLASFFRMCFARNSLISRRGARVEKRPSSDRDTNHDFRHAGRGGTPLLPTCGPNQFASSDRQFGDPADTWNFPASEIPVEVTKILLEFFHRLALGQIVGKLLEVAKPHIPVLPMDI